MEYALAVKIRDQTYPQSANLEYPERLMSKVTKALQLKAFRQRLAEKWRRLGGESSGSGRP